MNGKSLFGKDNGSSMVTLPIFSFNSRMEKLGYVQKLTRELSDLHGEIRIRELKSRRLEIIVSRELAGISPQQAYEFLINMGRESYLKWHPRDHKDFKILARPKEGIAGAIIYFKEQFENGEVLETKMEAIEAIPNERLVFRSVSPSWLSLVVSFEFSSTPRGTLVSHRMVLGPDSSLLGLLHSFFLRVAFSSEKVRIIHKHTMEEIGNMKALITPSQ